MQMMIGWRCARSRSLHERPVFRLADHFQRRESTPVQAIQKGLIKAVKLPRSNVSARKQKKTGKWNEAI
jgi:hypothetical protein